MSTYYRYHRQFHSLYMSLKALYKIPFFKGRFINMKLAKKMLAFVLAFAMVAALGTAMIASAADAPVITLTQTSANLGDTVTLTLSAANFAGSQSANIEIDYNPDELTFVSASPIDDGVEGDGVGDNLLTAAYFNMRAAKADNVDLISYTFTAKKVGTAVLNVRVIDFQQNEESVTPSVSNGSVTIGEPASVTDPEPVSPGPGPNPGPGPKGGSTTTTEPVSGNGSKGSGSKGNGGKIAATGDAGIALIAGVAAVAAVAFVATRKKEG